jgi:glycosyltransferase involved in cell wall biosynthesis
MKQTIGLCMIVKDDEINILDTGSTDKTLKIIKKVCKKPLRIEKINFKNNPEYFIEEDGHIELKFAKARNASFDMCTAYWTMWIDGDDTVENAKAIPNLVMQMDQRNITALGFEYKYVVDEKNNSRLRHGKERIVRTGMYRWEKSDNWLVHENLYVKSEYKHLDRAEGNMDVTIRHWASGEDQNKSGERNVRLLKHMIEKLGYENDPKAVFLLGRELFGCDRKDEAEKFLVRSLRMPLTESDRLTAAYYLSEIFVGRGDFLSALDYSFEAIKSRPDYPLGYLSAAKVYLWLGKYKDAIKYVQDALTRDYNPHDGAIHHDATMKLTSCAVLSQAYENLEQYDKAIRALESYIPEANELELELLSTDIERLSSKNEAQKVLNAFKHLGNTELMRQSFEAPVDKKLVLDKEPLLNLINLIPVELHKHKLVTRFKRISGLSTKHKKPHITLFCAMNFEEWDPKTILAKGGGGSETAVIEMASRWVESGYKVDVYANPPVNATVYEGVTYYRQDQIDWSDTFDIFMSWRNPWIFKDVEIVANKKFLWLQDVMNPLDYPQSVVDQLDKIIVLSKYHRSWLPHVPEDKFYYTTNGINTKLIEEAEQEVKEEREKGYCMYASSSDRGLEGLVDMWPEVQKEVPQSREVWFYGWDSWNKIRNPNSDAAKKWQEDMNEKMKKNNVVYGGRIGKKELYKEYFRCEFWTYPLVGPAETSCITAMEAQACGAYPITTGITALEETQQFGIKVDINEYKDTLIKALKGEVEPIDRVAMMKWAREYFNWDRVANCWINDLFYGNIK